MRDTKDLFNENYKSLKKTSEDGKNFHVLGLVESTL
jgi:hypothetical protein